jgi:hypothetical protein
MKFTSKSIEIVFADAFISDTKRIMYCAAILGVNDKQKQRKHCDEGEDGRAGSGWNKRSVTSFGTSNHKCTYTFVAQSR